MLDNVQFENVSEAIAAFSGLIKKFAEMLRNFIASWKKVPVAANGD